MDEAVDTINRGAGPVLVILVIALLAYIALRLIGRFATRLVERRMARSDADPITRSLTATETKRRLATITALVDWVFRVLIIGAAALAVLATLGLTPVIVGILVFLLVVAVVARDVIRDYVGGFLVIVENQYSIGDWVRIAGSYGEVEAVSLRRTTLRTEGGDVVTIPNGDLRVVENRTRGWARINLEVRIADIDQLERVRAAIDDASHQLVGDPRFGSAVIDPPRLMTISDIDERGIHVLIWGRIRATDRFDTEGEYRRLLLIALSVAGVETLVLQAVELRDAHARQVGSDPPAP